MNKYYWSQKKVVLFPEIGRVKSFLSPSRPHKPNLYEYIYFLHQKNTHTNKTISLANLFVRIYIFFHLKNKRWGSCFSTKKSAAGVVF